MERETANKQEIEMYETIMKLSAAFDEIDAELAVLDAKMDELENDWRGLTANDQIRYDMLAEAKQLVGKAMMFVPDDVEDYDRG